MTLHASNQVLCNVWSYNFYDMTLSTEQQRCHMIKNVLSLLPSFLCYPAVRPFSQAGSPGTSFSVEAVLPCCQKVIEII